MISIENLYWILYTNLLQPSGLDCCYYYPFGTTKHLSFSGEFQPYRPKHDHHVLFHFDQEPLFDTSLGKHYDNKITFLSTKICKLLANSEHSAIKKNICKQRDMLDWYFFYHGLASADWFRDAQFTHIQNQPVKVFASYNHNVSHKRSYRMALTARLFLSGLIPQGDISFHATQHDCRLEIENPYSELSDCDRNIIDSVLCMNRVGLPLLLDHDNVDGSFSARFGHQEYKLWQRGFWHLVNETVFYDTKLHLTEKTFKPIVALRPFILVAAPGNLEYLKSYGFRTFDNWIDESYDQILDHTRRLDVITQQLEQLCALSDKARLTMFNDMQDTLQFNKRHFFTDFLHIVIDEMVDNFDSCIRIWNNGRIDSDRVLPLVYNTDRVKQVLKGGVIADT